MRQTFKLTNQEIRSLRNLPPIPGVAIQWWRNKAFTLGLDPSSIMATDDWRFTALPLAHGKHWCYPVELKCRYKPPVELKD